MCLSATLSTRLVYIDNVILYKLSLAVEKKTGLRHIPHFLTFYLQHSLVFLPLTSLVLEMCDIIYHVF